MWIYNCGWNFSVIAAAAAAVVYCQLFNTFCDGSKWILRFSYLNILILSNSLCCCFFVVVLSFFFFFFWSVRLSCLVWIHSLASWIEKKKYSHCNLSVCVYDYELLCRILNLFHIVIETIIRYDDDLVSDFIAFSVFVFDIFFFWFYSLLESICCCRYNTRWTLGFFQTKKKSKIKIKIRAHTYKFF